jgi:cell wall-associated NlpC family hydrolase
MKTALLFLFLGLLTGCVTNRSPSHSALLDAFAKEAKPPSNKQASAKPSTHRAKQNKETLGGPYQTQPATYGARKKVVQTAQAFLGKQQIVIQGKKYRSDCSGFVWALYAQVDIDLMQAAQPQDNAVTAMFRYAKAHGKTFKGGWPVPGDLVFFRNTYRLKSRHSPAALTHIGIVESMDEDGTVYIIHHVPRGVVRYAMNLNYKTQTKSQHGKRVNDYIRARKGNQPAKLTSELFVSYASLLPVESALLAQN